MLFVMCSIAIVSTVASLNQIAAYICFSRRRASVPKKLIAKTTHTTVIAMSMGHSSSAYSFDEVLPASSETAAATMIAFQPHRLMRESVSENMRTRQRRWTP